MHPIWWLIALLLYGYICISSKNIFVQSNNFGRWQYNMVTLQWWKTLIIIHYGNFRSGRYVLKVQKRRYLKDMKFFNNYEHLLRSPWHQKLSSEQMSNYECPNYDLLWIIKWRRYSTKWIFLYHIDTVKRRGISLSHLLNIVFAGNKYCVNAKLRELTAFENDKQTLCLHI